ncbi:hypothetical protein GGR56DRAFT_675773 [Xylariaceae sp. FL0804]|nr:hypothetical protein GGR56DRAFT_675773 [Xylariaceae sp. FL0804]
MTEAQPNPGDERHHEEDASTSLKPSEPDATSRGKAGSDTGDERVPEVAQGISGAGEEADGSEEDEEEGDEDDEDDHENGGEDEDGAGQDEDQDEDESESEDEDEDDDEDDDEDEDDEPKLKYARLTQHLGPVYRNGDATSAFLVAGDKMIIGTHNGNIHVLQLPTFQSLLAYHAHDASITSIAISPFSPPSLPPSMKPEAVSRAVAEAAGRPASKPSESSAAGQRRARELPQIPNIPSNNIHIGTSSQDGMVRVQPLIDLKDFQTRNFARPVQAVALSPDFKNDRTYLSGGRAGSLILTVGAPLGRSTSTTTGTAAAAASGWLSSVGIGANTGKDTVLHSGEGAISTIKWSLSGKYVVWLNEHGIKIMRTNLHLESADAEHAWKRVGHQDRPETDEWDQMAGYWEGRAEWIDDQAMDDEDGNRDRNSSAPASPAATRLGQQAKSHDKSVGKYVGEKSAGGAEAVKILRLDCIISGVSLYTPSLLLVLAYCRSTDEDEEEHQTRSPPKGHKPNPSITSSGSEPSGGIKRRQNALRPELRLIDLTSKAEVDKDSLTVSRFERLGSNDYHLGVLPAKKAASVAASRGTLEALAGLGEGLWNAAINPRSLLSSGASVRSKGSNDAASGSRAASTSGTIRGTSQLAQTAHPNLVKPGAKIFIHSMYDCILATRRDLDDHLDWLMERQRYREAWELLDEHPEIMSSQPESLPERRTSTSEQGTSTTDDFYEDTSSIMEAQQKASNTAAEREKRRIGELWVEELVEEGDWAGAGKVVARVVRTPDRWEKWIYTFAGAKRFDEIVNYIPSEPLHPPIPGTVYEIVLGHYLRSDKPRFRELIDTWGLDLFNIQEVSTALENQLKYRDVREDSVEDGEKGRDWRIVMESLARLHEANGRHREALKCFIKLQDADAAMRLIRDNHLADAVMDDVPSFIALRVPEAQMSRMSIEELADATSEAITLLVDEASRGLVKPDVVVSQLDAKNLNLYLYFYFRGLWREYREQSIDESVSLLDDFADLAVHIFAVFDRETLMDFLRVSTNYRFEKAVQECENANYIPELVYLYSKTGQMKRALYLIIDRLRDVSQAITFAKEQDDPDLWEDLLNYSMDKPRFIRGLLEEVGTSIDPITLVRRIPEGLEIPGLREGLKHIMKEHEIQYSISSGVARVLRSEVAAAQNQLRTGQQKGIKFNVIVQADDHVDIVPSDEPATARILPASALRSIGSTTPRTSSGAGTPATAAAATTPETTPTPRQPQQQQRQQQQQHSQPGHEHHADEALRPGHCAHCREPFTEWEPESLVGFACGHAFHVAHLLEALHPGGQGVPVDADLLGRGAGDRDRRTRGGRSVGSKVTHARLLRDRIGDGCPVCAGWRGQGGEVGGWVGR